MKRVNESSCIPKRYKVYYDRKEEVIMRKIILASASPRRKELLELSAKYVADSVSLAQSYFYLTYLIGEKLSEENLNTMQVYFCLLYTSPSPRDTR